jgi:predicted transposase YdaD
MDERVRAEASENESEELWASTYLLSGLRFNAGESEALLGKVVAQMRESSTYQKILQDGRAEGVVQGERNLLVLVGTALLHNAVL